MVDWLLGKLGLMRVSDHDKAYDLIIGIWGDDCENYEDRIERMRKDSSETIQFINSRHTEAEARIQREADYWRDECLKARGSK